MLIFFRFSDCKHRVLREVCADGMCVAIHRNDKCHAMLKTFMPCIARKYLLIRTATYFSKALIFGYFLIKQKVREKNISIRYIHEQGRQVCQNVSHYAFPVLIYRGSIYDSFESLNISLHEGSFPLIRIDTRNILAANLRNR